MEREPATFPIAGIMEHNGVITFAFKGGENIFGDIIAREPSRDTHLALHRVMGRESQGNRIYPERVHQEHNR